MGIVTTDNKHYKDIAEQLRKYGSYGTYYPHQMAAEVDTVYAYGKHVGRNEGVDEGFSDGYRVGKTEGAQAEYDRFWDAYQLNGNRTAYTYCFGGSGWIDETYNPKYPINATLAANYMFSYTGITDTKVDIDLGGSASNKVAMFDNASQLVTIRKLKGIPENLNFATQFTNCKKLVNIVCEGTIGRNIDMQWCPLSGDSIRNIVSCLSATATGYTVTFKKSAKETAFTDEEWNALIATKSNWTFSLV